MRKTARLDEILLGLGYVDSQQIDAAMKLQTERGGRLGMNLVEIGAIDEKQLLTALAEQFRIPVMVPKEGTVPEELAARMPADILADGVAIPLSWNEVQGVLSVAVADPGDADTLRRVKEAFDARGVRVSVAPERILETLSRRLQTASGGDDEERGIALPELFAWAGGDDPADETARASDEGERRRVLMLASSASKRNFLPPLFQREGVDLLVVSELDELQSALSALEYDAILVHEGMTQAYREWVDSGQVSEPTAEVSMFSSVTGALLENPLPYAEVSRSLRSAVEALADARCASLDVSPPYGLIGADLRALAQAACLPRLARDGLELGMHLLIPGRKAPFARFDSSLELASHLRFPWPLDELLATCQALFFGRLRADAGAGTVHRAAQILALAWFRHNHIVVPDGTEEERVTALRTALRKASGRLATAELVEAYVQILADRTLAPSETGMGPVVLVGGERLRRALAPALKRVGRDVVSSEALMETHRWTQANPHAAIVVDYDEFPGEVHKFTRVAKLGASSSLFALSDSDDASLVLNLLDAGVDDVFAPPHDFGLIAARINRAIRSRAQIPGAPRTTAGQFSATCEVFSFIDLLQMLGHGRKTVRIDLTHEAQTAVVYMREGALVHAECGESVGEAAVYRVIRWEDRGEFTVHEESDFPSASISAATESVLMEGCRLLDESKREAVG